MDHGYTQDDFAWSVGVSKAQISRLEAGKREPSKTLIRLICNVFEVNEEWLLHGSGKKYSKETVIHMADHATAWQSSAAYIFKYIHIAKALSASCNLDDAIWEIFNSLNHMEILNFFIDSFIRERDLVLKNKSDDAEQLRTDIVRRLESAFPEFEEYSRLHTTKFFHIREELSQLEIWKDADNFGFSGIDDPTRHGLLKGMELEEKLLSHRIYTAIHEED